MLLNRGELADWKHETLRSLELSKAPALGGSDPIASEVGRRDFLRILGVSALGGGLLSSLDPWSSAHADEPPEAVKTGTFIFPRLKFSVKDETEDQWFIYPVGDTMLRKNLAKLTNINVSHEPVIVSLAEMDSMCRYPFVFMTSEGYFDTPKNEQANLKEFLMRGGFIHADDCVWSRGMGGKSTLPTDMPDGVFRQRPKNSPMDGDRFFYDFLKLMKELFPENPLRRVPLDHEIYSCYFKFPNGSPHFQGVDHGGWGLFEKGTGRIMAFDSPGDLHCAWTFRFWNEETCMKAIKMGINIIIYFLTH